MITRGLRGGWRAGCAGAPPPLHVRHDNPGANWYPLPRIALFPHQPGPVMIHIPIAAPFGDDPTDPGQQTIPRVPTAGMVGRLNPKDGAR